jgi:hypothetical protein
MKCWTPPSYFLQNSNLFRSLQIELESEIFVHTVYIRVLSYRKMRRKIIHESDKVVDYRSHGDDLDTYEIPKK